MSPSATALPMGFFKFDHRPGQMQPKTPRLKQFLADKVAILSEASSNQSLKALSWLTPSRRAACSPPVRIRSREEAHRAPAAHPPASAGRGNGSSHSLTLCCGNDDGVGDGDGDGVARTTSASEPPPSTSLADSLVAEQVLQASSEQPSSQHLTLSALGACVQKLVDDNDQNIDMAAASLVGLSRKASRASFSLQRHQLQQDKTKMDHQSTDEVAVDVCRLISDTEKAFEAVDRALREVKLDLTPFQRASESAPSPSVPTSPHPERSPATPSERKSLSQRRASKAGRPASRQVSVFKSSRNKRKLPKARATSSTRQQVKALPWTLSEGVSNVLSGQRFKRVVADEVLTPTRLEQIRKNEEARRRHGCNAHNCHHGAKRSAAPPEPSRECEDTLPSSTIGLSGARNSPCSFLTGSSRAKEELIVREADQQKLMPLKSPAVDRRKPADSFREAILHPTDTKVREAISHPTEVKVREAFPQPTEAKEAIKSHARVARRNSPAASRNREASGNASRYQPGSSWLCMTDDFIHLRGVELSAANRSYKHGPIVIQNPHSEDAVPRADIDPTVNWLEFQLAIMGGAGELQPQGYEENDRQMADELADWFDSFGFEGHGQLVNSTLAGWRPASQATSSGLSSSSSTVGSEPELPIPLHMEAPRGYGTQQAFPSTPMKFYRGSNRRLWQQQQWAGWAPKKHLDDGKQAAGMPRVVGIDALPEDRLEMVATVSMGCNLEHDLGDFLRWEAAHLCGGI